MLPFTLLVKPVGAACNLACRYCFYRAHPAGVMSARVFGRMLESYAALPFAGKAVALQGGEPLLAPDYVFDGLDATPLARSLQTNATLLTPARAARLAAGGWLVGVSLDGPPALNALRHAPAGPETAARTFAETVRGIRLLEEHRVDYNLVAVVSRRNVRAPAEVYRYLRDNFATRHHQYIECTGPCEEITAAEWGEFLCGLFDAWSARDAYTLSIRLFDSLVSQLVRGHPTQCSFAGSCRQYLVVEHDGSVYPCDFHVRDDLRLGNVMTHTWEELVSSPRYLRFAAAKCARLAPECRQCPYFDFCRGDCPRNRTDGRTRLCAGWRRFFAHALGRLGELVREMP